MPVHDGHAFVDHLLHRNVRFGENPTRIAPTTVVVDAEPDAAVPKSSGFSSGMPQRWQNGPLDIASLMTDPSFGMTGCNRRCIFCIVAEEGVPSRATLFTRKGMPSRFSEKWRYETMFFRYNKTIRRKAFIFEFCTGLFKRARPDFSSLELPKRAPEDDNGFCSTECTLPEQEETPEPSPGFQRNLRGRRAEEEREQTQEDGKRPEPRNASWKGARTENGERKRIERNRRESRSRHDGGAAGMAQPSRKGAHHSL